MTTMSIIRLGFCFGNILFNHRLHKDFYPLDFGGGDGGGGHSDFYHLHTVLMSIGTKYVPLWYTGYVIILRKVT